MHYLFVKSNGYECFVDSPQKFEKSSVACSECMVLIRCESKTTALIVPRCDTYCGESVSTDRGLPISGQSDV